LCIWSLDTFLFCFVSREKSVVKVQLYFLPSWSPKKHLTITHPGTKKKGKHRHQVTVAEEVQGM
jgi:hypothetical protein